MQTVYEQCSLNVMYSTAAYFKLLATQASVLSS